MMRFPVLVAWLLLVGHAGLMHQALTVWRSDLTLWRHAAHIAPQKPRVLTNYGVSLIQARVVEAGVERLVQAERASHAAHVPPADRAITRAAVERNLRGLGIR